MKRAFLCLMLLCSAAAASATEELPQFSADMISVSENGTVEGKMFVATDRTRFEMGPSVIITRMDKNVAWVVMQSQGIYLEQAIDPNAAARISKEVPGTVERVSVGPDAVNGRPAEKSRITYQSVNGTQQMYQWTASGSPVPLKVAAVDGSWSVEYRNIQVGVQDPSLFELPPGVNPMQMPTSVAEAMKAAQAGQGELE